MWKDVKKEDLEQYYQICGHLNFLAIILLLATIYLGAFFVLGVACSIALYICSLSSIVMVYWAGFWKVSALQTEFRDVRDWITTGRTKRPQESPHHRA